MRKKRFVSFRGLSQAFFLLLFTYLLWTATYPLNVAVPLKAVFGADPLATFFTAISERVLMKGLALGAFILVMTFILGRFFCGWVCPLGAVLDIVSLGRQRKDAICAANHKNLYRAKFYLLTGLFILAVCGIQLVWFFAPTVIMGRFISLNFIPALTAAVDLTLIFLIKKFQLYGAGLDFYRLLKSSILGIKTYYFSHAVIIALFFTSILAGTFFTRRLWCRAVCPLGALFALISKKAFFTRFVSPCARCNACVAACRMGAIKEDASYFKAECILCMDCIHACAGNNTRFAFPANTGKAEQKRPTFKSKRGVSRRDFLFLFCAGITAVAIKARHKPGAIIKNAFVLRPPAALQEEKFLNRCVRCGNCMKVCPTNALQPVSFEAGFAGIWTPQLLPQIGYCEYNCNLCAKVCPTGAITDVGLERKKKLKLGLAKIDRRICLPWHKKKECLVCEEHCPIPDKAIRFKKELVEGKELLRPYVDINLCTGCGICVTRCPVQPRRAVKIFPTSSDRII
ncbi:MAG: 4Fe-4S binding protein [Candidatus Omnitrophota bacterium]